MDIAKISGTHPGIGAADGADLGEVTAVHVTADMQHAVLATVATGDRHVLVPLLGGAVRGRQVVVPYSVELVETAPDAPTHDLGLDEINAVLRHFGLDDATPVQLAGTPPTAGRPDDTPPIVVLPPVRWPRPSVRLDDSDV